MTEIESNETQRDPADDEDHDGKDHNDKDHGPADNEDRDGKDHDDKDHGPADNKDHGSAPGRATIGHHVYAAARHVGKNLGIVLSLCAALLIGMWLSSGSSVTSSASVGASPQVKREWTCPMHPQIRKDQPGTCPICGMELVEVHDAASAQPNEHGEPGEHGDGPARTRVTLSDRAKILARIRTQEIKPMSTAARELRLLGRVDYDETRVKSVTAWTAGRIDKLLVATTGRTIKEGQTVAKLYSPEIYGAQSDLIQAAKQVQRLQGSSEMARSAADAALLAARQRLRLLGVPRKDIDDMQKADTPRTHTWISAPVGGTVIARLVDEGNYVNAGTALYRVADLRRVWIQLDAYETDTPLLRVGDRVSLTIVGLPDKSFEGQVAFIDPVVDKGTRIVKVRVEVDNPDGDLRPGMFAEAVLHSERASAATLMLPRTAPLFTGQRSLVYVEVPNSDRPTYEAREVIVGPRAGEWYPVIDGLEVGERVVVRGSFVIDADLQIKGGRSMMTRDDDVMREAGQPVAEVPHRVRQRAADVVARYLDIRRALATGDLANARQISLRLAESVVLVSAEMPDKLQPRWQPLATEITDYARYLAGHDDTARARLTFRRLSERLLTLLQTYGNPLDTPMRVLYCAHDFEHSGAHWLQTRDEAPGNPYRDATAEPCVLIRAEVLAGAHLQPLPEPSRPAGDNSGAGASPAGDNSDNSDNGDSSGDAKPASRPPAGHQH